MAVWLGARPGAHAADLDEYRRLSAAAQGLLELMEAAEGEQLRGLREGAVAADLALLDWLDAFVAGDDFAALPPDQQAAVYSDRYRWEHNLSVQLLALERCEEARDRIRSLLDAAYVDAELRPLLTEGYAQAAECVARQEAEASEARVVRLRITGIAPPDAQIYVDDVAIGQAPLEIELEPGRHVLRIEAAGYAGWSSELDAEAGQDLVVGPLALSEARVEDAPPPRAAGPGWEHWTLWSVGTAGIGTGVALFVAARGREDTVDDPPTGFHVTDEPYERDRIDTMDIAAYVTLGVGVAAVVTGTVLYVTRDDATDHAGAGEPLSWGWVVTPDALGLTLGGSLP